MVKMLSNSDAWHDSVLSDEIQNVLMLMNDDNSFSSSTFDLPLRHVSVVWSVVSFSSSEGYGFVSLVQYHRESYLACNCLCVCVCNETERINDSDPNLRSPKCTTTYRSRTLRLIHQCIIIMIIL